MTWSRDERPPFQPFMCPWSCCLCSFEILLCLVMLPTSRGTRNFPKQAISFYFSWNMGKPPTQDTSCRCGADTWFINKNDVFKAKQPEAINFSWNFPVSPPAGGSKRYFFLRFLGRRSPKTGTRKIGGGKVNGGARCQKTSRWDRRFSVMISLAMHFLYMISYS